MRRIIALAVAVMLLCGAALAEHVPGNRLGLKVLAELSAGEQNAVVSPVSLAWALSMAAEGAQGETRNRLLAALDAESPEDVAALGGPLGESGLRWANAVFAEANMRLLPEFEQRLTEGYGAERFPLGDAEAANAWVSERTDGLIDALPGDVGEDAQLLLVNAVAMDAAWASPFDPALTRPDDFHAPDGDVRVDFMHQRTYAQYGESMGIKFIRKSYDDGLTMILALPSQNGMKSALESLGKSGLDLLSAKPNPQDVLLSLPRLDMDTAGSLIEAIKATGCALPFDPERADFTGISGEGAVISDVVQRARLQVDEAGTRAAAVTEVEIEDTAAMAEEDEAPIDFNLNRPFLLLVADRATNAICFAAAIYNPLS